MDRLCDALIYLNQLLFDLRTHSLQLFVFLYLSMLRGICFTAKVVIMIVLCFLFFQMFALKVLYVSF